MSPRMHRTSWLGALAIVVALGSTTTVHAGQARFALNGTWTGTIKCKSFKAGVKAKSTLAATMRVDQSGLELGIEVDFGPGGGVVTYTGVGNPDAKKPLEKGEAAIVGCGTNDQVGDDVSLDEIGRMTVKGNFEDVKGSFKGTTLFSRPGLIGAEAGTCKWSFKRTVADFPQVPFVCSAGLTAP